MNHRDVSFILNCDICGYWMKISIELERFGFFHLNGWACDASFSVWKPWNRFISRFVCAFLFSFLRMKYIFRICSKEYRFFSDPFDRTINTVADNFYGNLEMTSIKSDVKLPWANRESVCWWNADHFRWCTLFWVCSSQHERWPSIVLVESKAKTIVLWACLNKYKEDFRMAHFTKKAAFSWNWRQSTRFVLETFP